MTLTNIWTGAKKTIWKYGGSLVTETKDNGSGAVLSLGRVSFLVLFGLALWMWAPFLGGESTELPGDMFSMLLTLAGYNLGTKLVTTARDVFASRASGSPPALPPDAGDVDG